MLASERSIKHAPQEPFAAFPLAMVPSNIPPSTAEGEDALGDQSLQQLENAKPPSVEKQLTDSLSHTPSVDSPAGLFKPNQNFFDGFHTQASIQNQAEPQRDFLQDAMLASDRSVKHVPQEPFAAHPLSVVPSSIPPSTAEGEDALGDQSLQQLENAKPPSVEKQLTDSLSHTPSVDSPAGLFKPNQNFFDGVRTQASVQNLPEPQRDFLQDAMLASERSVKRAPQKPFAAFPLAVVPSSIPPSTAEGEDAPGDQSLQQLENAKPPSIEKQMTDSLSHTPSVDNPAGLFKPNQNFFDGFHTQASMQNQPEPQRDFLQDAMLASERSVKHAPPEPFVAFPLAVMPSSIPPSTAKGEDAPGDQSVQQLENAKPPSGKKQLTDSLSHTPSVDNPPGLFKPNQNFFDGVDTQRDFLQDAMLASDRCVKHTPQEPFAAFPLTMMPSSIPPYTAEGKDAPGDQSLQQLENAKPPSVEKQLTESLSHTPSVDSPAGLFKPNQNFFDGVHTQASIQNLPEPQRDFLQDAMLTSDRSGKHTPQEPFTALLPTLVPSSIPPATTEGEDAPGNQSLQQIENTKPPSLEKQLPDSLSHAPSLNSPPGLFKPNQDVEATDVQPHPSGQAQLDETSSGLFKPGSVIEEIQPCPQMELSLPEVIQQNSPNDACRAAFHQRQLAGKAPTSSPQTSLWTNSAPLPTPCLLAPAADQASPVERKVLYKI